MTASSLNRIGRLLFLLALPFSTARAHPRLMSAIPAAESRVRTLPRALTLSFSEPLAVALSRVALFDETLRKVELDTLRAGANDTKTLTATIIGTLSAGRYTVKWQAAGADGHPVRGEYTFLIDLGGGGAGLDAPISLRPDLAAAEIGPTSAAGLEDVRASKAHLITAALSASAPQSTPEFGVESPMYVAIRAVQSIAVVALLGILAMQLGVLSRYARQTNANAEVLHAAKRAALPWLAVTLSVTGVATVARLGAQHAALFGATESWSRETVGALLLHSSWGLAWCLAAASTIVGFWALGRVRRDRRYAWPLLTAASLVLVASIAMSGHAAAAAAPTTAMIIHALHVIGAGGWMGSLAALVVIAIPTAIRTGVDDVHVVVAGLLNAFSPTALFFAGLVSVTGAVAAWRNLGTLEAIWLTSYGQVLMLKLVMLSVAAATGAFNWKVVLPSLGTVTGTARLRTSARIELAAALVILVVTAILVATPMPVDMATPGTK